ncbi:TetR/AcrR family transcriptional regulator [Marisediminicola senii]|uniref:TetR/AcrR family transcriptional regulator n=1 Tax=Marisediminicola senii TaxID=2711233 RepID=UPI0013EE05AA|nr:TetR/AcrR family transcriptional regulator [Marisediminicola senii]
MGIRASTEKKLLDAADELFFTAGISATPIDAVLARAGVSAATLYRGYPSKEALVAAALDRRHASWLEVWDRAIGGQQTWRGRVLAIFDALDEFRGRADGARWCAFLGSAAEYADAPDEISAAVTRDTDSMRARLHDLAAPAGEPRATEIADQLLLIVTGELAMRLRDAHHDSAIARTIATSIARSD